MLEFKEPRIVLQDTLKHKVFEALVTRRLTAQELAVICDTAHNTIRKTLSRLTENKCVEPIDFKGKAYVYKLTEMFKHLNGMKYEK